MLIAASLKKLLDRHRLNYRVLRHKRTTLLETAASFLNIDIQNVLTAQVLADKSGKVLVVYPVGRQIDLNACCSVLQRDLKVLPAIEVNRIFFDCEANSWPAVGQLYGLDIILDKSLKQLSKVYFASGCHTALVQMPLTDYLILNSRTKIANVSTAASIPVELACTMEAAQVHGLIFPPLPPIALQILQLSVENKGSIAELAELIATDGLMQQQIAFYSQLPFIQAKLTQGQNEHNALHVVEHILGFEMVSHIALGFAAGRAFNMPGVVLEEFWRHAFYAAIYAQRLTEIADPALNLDPGISYLSGLFHNFGLLLFSQLFPPEYRLLKKWQTLNPKISIAILEQRLLGMGQAFNVIRGGHAQLGEWLLQFWGMPQAICVITKEHHSLLYKGEYVNYVRIIQLTNQLLRQDGIGDGTLAPIDEQMVASLGLDMSQVQACISQIKNGGTDLDKMARSLTNSSQL